MLPNQSNVQEIWSRSGVGTPYVEGRRAKTHWMKFDDLPSDQPHATDLYFTPLVFNGGRQNLNAVHMGVLFADLDPVDPESIDWPKPSVAWETSPGMYQAVWYLESYWDFYNEWADVNQRLTYFLGADRGGWMGSKLLRWPGSINWKRKRDQYVPVGSLVIATEREYDFREMRDKLPSISKPVPSLDDTAPHPNLLPPSELNWLLRLYWNDLSLQARSMLTRQRVADRSLFIVRVAHELAACGVAPEAAFHMVWVQPWNKWRTDRHNPERLWQEILSVQKTS